MNAAGGEFSVGQLEVGMTWGHGYGTFNELDPGHPEYKPDITSDGPQKVKFAEQDFLEECVGINLVSGISKNFDNLFSFGIGLST